MYNRIMAEHDESLEIGLAAGLDVPTAMVLSEVDDRPPPEPQKKSKAGYAMAIIVGLIALTLYLLI